MSAARLTRLAALGPPSLLAGQRSRRPAVATIATIVASLAAARRHRVAASRLATVAVAAVIVAISISLSISIYFEVLVESCPLLNQDRQ